MLIVKESIVSDDIAQRRFCCDLAQCKGRCCIEGDYGAPLLEEEIPVLQRILPAVEPYMTEAGRAVIAEQGVSTLDNAAEPCTPLVNNRECAYVAWTPDGTALCAIEQAFRDGKTDFMKPVSCHLYPPLCCGQGRRMRGATLPVPPRAAYPPLWTGLVRRAARSRRLPSGIAQTSTKAQSLSLIFPICFPSFSLLKGKNEGNISNIE